MKVIFWDSLEIYKEWTKTSKEGKRDDADDETYWDDMRLRRARSGMRLSICGKWFVYLLFFGIKLIKHGG